MTVKTTVQKIGDDYGIILPKETLETMNVQEGDVLYISQTSEASVTLSPQDKDFERVMKLAKDCMDRYPNALRELAE